MDPAALYRLTLFAVQAHPRAYSRSSSTVQLPSYCASPFLLAAPGARTSGLHAACFGPGGHPLAQPALVHLLRTVPCFFIVFEIASVLQRATSPTLFKFGLHARRPLHLRVERPHSLFHLVTP